DVSQVDRGRVEPKAYDVALDLEVPLVVEPRRRHRELGFFPKRRGRGRSGQGKALGPVGVWRRKRDGGLCTGRKRDGRRCVPTAWRCGNRGDEQSERAESA